LLVQRLYVQQCVQKGICLPGVMAVALKVCDDPALLLNTFLALRNVLLSCGEVF
jgi:hypothetical protein